MSDHENSNATLKIQRKRNNVVVKNGRTLSSKRIKQKEKETHESSHEPLEGLNNGTGSTLMDLNNGTGSTLEDLNNGTDSTLDNLNNGTGSTLEDLNNGTGSTLDNLNNVTGSTPEDLKNGTGSTLENLNNGTGSTCKKGTMRARFQNTTNTDPSTSHSDKKFCIAPVSKTTPTGNVVAQMTTKFESPACKPKWDIRIAEDMVTKPNKQTSNSVGLSTQEPAENIRCDDTPVSERKADFQSKISAMTKENISKSKYDQTITKPVSKTFNQVNCNTDLSTIPGTSSWEPTLECFNAPVSPPVRKCYCSKEVELSICEHLNGETHSLQISVPKTNDETETKDSKETNNLYETSTADGPLTRTGIEAERSMAMSNKAKVSHLYYLTQHGGTKLVRALFLKQVTELRPETEDPATWTVAMFLNRNKETITSSKFYRQANSFIFPAEGQDANLDQWDLSLFLNILKATCKLNPDMLMRLSALKKIRNKLAHLGDSNIEDTKYKINFDKIRIIFDAVLKNIDDEELEKNIRDMLQKAENGEIPENELGESLQALHRRFGELTNTVKCEHIETRQTFEKGKTELLAEITSLKEMLFAGKDNGFSGPPIAVKLKPKNIPTVLDQHLSHVMVDMFSEEIKKITGSYDTPDEQKMRDAVHKFYMSLKENGYEIVKAEEGCILLHVQFSSFTSVLSFYADYIDGSLDIYVLDLQKAVSNFLNFQEFLIEMNLYEEDFLEVISNIRDYVESMRLPRTGTHQHEGQQCIPACKVYETDGGRTSVLLTVKPPLHFERADLEKILASESKLLVNTFNLPTNLGALTKPTTEDEDACPLQINTYDVCEVKVDTSEAITAELVNTGETEEDLMIASTAGRQHFPENTTQPNIRLQSKEKNLQTENSVSGNDPLQDLCPSCPLQIKTYDVCEVNLDASEANTTEFVDTVEMKEETTTESQTLSESAAQPEIRFQPKGMNSQKEKSVYENFPLQEECPLEIKTYDVYEVKLDTSNANTAELVDTGKLREDLMNAKTAESQLLPASATQTEIRLRSKEMNLPEENNVYGNDPLKGAYPVEYNSNDVRDIGCASKPETELHSTIQLSFQKEENIQTVSKDSRVQAIKENLTQYYREAESKIPMSPIAEDHLVPLEELYVIPPMLSYDLRLQNDPEHYLRPVLDTETRNQKLCSVAKYLPKATLRQVFFSEDNVRYKKIYLTANAGVGKTSFSQQIAMTWCQSHSPLKSQERIYKDVDLETMKYFDLLFLIHLRDNRDDTKCNVDDLIEDLLLKVSDKKNVYTKTFVQKLLQEHKCLVILDGLDEWDHPTKCKTSPAVPHIRYSNTCAVLTTCSLWKMQTLKLSSSQIDHLLEICELGGESLLKLEINAFRLLNSRKGVSAEKLLSNFHKEVDTFGIGHILRNPSILLHFITLFFDDIPIGKSQCEIYINIIEFTLIRGLRKHNVPDKPVSSNNEVAVPKCINTKETCNLYVDLILRLGKFAFHVLFCEKKKSNLYFDRKLVAPYLTMQDVDFCLKVGLLYQTSDGDEIAVNPHKVSFQHKSLQEYFAALYIASGWDNEAFQSIVMHAPFTNLSISEILELSNIFVFLCGMNPTIYSCISIALQEIIDHYDTSITSTDYVDYYSDTSLIESYQSMQVRCFQESVRNNNGNIYIPLHNVLLDKNRLNLEKHYVIDLKTILNSNKGNVKSLRLSEDKTVTAFLLTVDRGVFSSLEMLMAHDCEETKWLRNIFSESYRTLKYLRLSGKLHTEPDISVNEISGLACLQTLYLAKVTMNHSSLKSLHRYLSNSTTLRQLNLVDIKCSDHENQGGDCDVASELRNLNKVKLGTMK